MSTAVEKKHIQPSPETRADRVWETFVQHRFQLGSAAVGRVRALPWSFGFGGLSEVVYFDHYSRVVDGRRETWPDTVLRCVGGCMSIRKNFYVRNRLAWDEGRWQDTAEEMARYFLALKCSPPGRGIFAVGTEMLHKRLGAAANNCAAKKVMPETFAYDLGWVMDMLMHAAGVGVECVPRKFSLQMPTGFPVGYVIHDTREAWVESLEVLLRSYVEGSGRVEFDYSEIRARGEPLATFGGQASGPEPLMKLHARTREYCERFARGESSWVRLVADVANAIGACVVAGGNRRSSMILIGSPDDPEFLDLKDYDRHPERAEVGWASNNSVRLSESRHFEMIPEIAARMRVNGEPGWINQIAMQKFARFGREKPDAADLTNPCGEQPLEDAEMCCLADVYPSRCRDAEEIIRAQEIAGIFASTVSLLPTHRADTNRVMARNRRIGVSMSGVADWMGRISAAEMTRTMRRAYSALVKVNADLAEEAGVRAAVRVSTCKPGGTTALLPGVSPGGHFALFEHYVRRKRVSTSSPVHRLLVEAGYPREKDAYADATDVFEFPIAQPGVRTQAQAGMHEQALQAVTLQREHSDNAVSYTITFDRSEGERLGNLLAQVAPMLKSVSCLPREDHGYKQPPYEPIAREEFEKRSAVIKPIDWGAFVASAGGDAVEADKFCSSSTCEVRPREKSS